MICSGISTTATTNSRPKKVSLHLELGCVVHAAVFSAMQGTEIWSCLLHWPVANGHSLGPVEPASVREGGQTTTHTHTHEGEKGCKTVCRHRHPLHDYHRFLLPSRLAEPKPAVVTVLGSESELTCPPVRPTARRHLDRTEAEDREYNAMFHIQALSFSVNYISKCTMLPDDLIPSRCR